MLRTDMSEPHLFRDWRLLLLYGVIISLGIFLIHGLVYLNWDREATWLGKEYIMGTHDAYHWLAGAKDFGIAQGSPPSLLVKWGEKITGVPMGLLAFWLPALATILMGLVMLFWCWSLGCMEAGLFAGLLSGLSPGFFMRLRVGFYDTDVVTLLFPLLVTVLFAHWIAGHLKPLHGIARMRGWLEYRRILPQMKEEAADKPVQYWLPLVAGVIAGHGSFWHSSIVTFSNGFFLVLILFTCILVIRSKRNEILLGVCVYGVSTLYFPWGAAAGLAIALAQRIQPDKLRFALAKNWPILVLIILILIVGRIPKLIYSHTNYLVLSYVHGTVDQGKLRQAEVPDAMVFPGITQSVIEAQHTSFEEILSKLHFFKSVSILGLLGYVLVALLYPQALLLLPLIFLFLLSYKLGIRFSMFGGPSMALGLGLPLCWACRKLLGNIPNARLWLAVLIFFVAVALCIPYYNRYPKMAPKPIFSKSYAQAFQKLEEITPEDARIWTWWDWGYAAHYYGRRMSFADGARHDGPYVYTLGLAMTAPSLRQSNQLIRYMGEHGYDPDGAWGGMTIHEVNDLLNKLKDEDLNLHPDSPAYFAIGLDDIPLMSWITYYGTWDPVKESGKHGTAFLLRGKIVLDLEKGTVLIKDSNKLVELKSLTNIDGPKPMSRKYCRLHGYHLITAAGRYVLMDDQVFQSTAMTLFLSQGDNPDVDRYFRLVYDDFPNIRIYEVR